MIKRIRKIPEETTFKEILMSLAGILSVCFALKGFLIPNHFFDGGVTGIALLIHESNKANIASTIVLCNIPFILFSIKLVDLMFAIKSFIGIIILGICLHYIPVNIISEDKLLVSVFGGFFLGLGIGLGMQGGCAIDGIDILATYTLKKVGFSISEVILGLNVVIFLIAAIFFGLETALYSMLTYFVASRTIDYIIEGIQSYTGLTIISAGKSEMIKNYLVEELGKGITIYKGERGFIKGMIHESHSCDIIYTVVTRLEIRKLKNAINQIDDKAFLFSSGIRETSGGILKKRRH